MFLSIVHFQAIAAVDCNELNEEEFIKGHGEESRTKTDKFSIFHITHRLVGLLKLGGGHTTGSHKHCPSLACSRTCMRLAKSYKIVLLEVMGNVLRGHFFTVEKQNAGTSRKPTSDMIFGSQLSRRTEALDK